MDFKICSHCGASKLRSDFHNDNAKHDGKRNNCKQCVRIRMQDHRLANIDVYRARERASKKKYNRGTLLLTKYGLSPEEYRRMEKEQKGLCFLCNQLPDSTRSLAVDHDHETGKVRRLLCNRCNTAIGSLQHSPALLRKAAEYLETDHGTGSCRDFRGEDPYPFRNEGQGISEVCPWIKVVERD